MAPGQNRLLDRCSVMYLTDRSGVVGVRSLELRRPSRHQYVSSGLERLRYRPAMDIAVNLDLKPSPCSRAGLLTGQAPMTCSTSGLLWACNSEVRLLASLIWLINRLSKSSCIWGLLTANMKIILMST